MKSVVRVMVALLTFVVGISSSQLWSLRQREVIEIAPVLKLEVVDEPAISPSTETWQKIVVKGRFSFYIPPYLNDDRDSVMGPMALGAFRKGNYDGGGLFYLDYYSDNTTEHDPRKEPDRYKFTVRSEVTIGGKHASMITEIPTADEIFCIHDTASVQVYFPDIGRGRHLYMRLSSYGAEGIEVAKRVVESIEFLDPIASNPRLKQARRY